MLEKRGKRQLREVRDEIHQKVKAKFNKKRITQRK